MFAHLFLFLSISRLLFRITLSFYQLYTVIIINPRQQVLYQLIYHYQDILPNHYYYH